MVTKDLLHVGVCLTRSQKHETRSRTDEETLDEILTDYTLGASNNKASHNTSFTLEVALDAFSSRTVSVDLGFGGSQVRRVGPDQRTVTEVAVKGLGGVEVDRCVGPPALFEFFGTEGFVDHGLQWEYTIEEGARRENPVERVPDGFPVSRITHDEVHTELVKLGFPGRQLNGLFPAPGICK